MPFRRVPLILTSVLSLVIALCLTQAGLTQPAHAAVAARQARAAGPAQPGGTASGSDSSCPAATPGRGRVGHRLAPRRVRAIGGDGSATVVWCPPASGAGSVVSYTVTSSGGQ